MTVDSTTSSEYMLGPELGAIIVDRYEGGTDEYGCYSGQGEALFRSGNTYSGHFRRGIMDGHGLYVWASDGTLYEGDVRNNKLMGTGRYKWGDGSSYEGGIGEGLRNGYGTFASADGTLVYEGSWKASKRHGYGVQQYGVGTTGGSSYAGDWKENCRDGYGTMTYVSGNTYEGEWVKDRKEGKGIMNWAERRERYTGEWVADLQCGFGEHVWIEDRPEPSEAMDTKKQMCNVYNGRWFDGMRHGQGTFMYADGSRHTGQWYKNMKHGPAVFISDSGQNFEGRFEKDVMVGTLSQDEDHPELSSAVKLKIADLLKSGDETARAAVVRDVERSALQINSDLKLLYKHYAKPGVTAPRNSNIFTMSMMQFVAFARDCRALTPSTTVTVGEVYRIFSRMRQQHNWELKSSLNRAMEEASKDSGKGGKASTNGGNWGTVKGAGDKGMSENEAYGGIYDSRRAITFRDFVEGTIRLGKIVDNQTGCSGIRPFSQGSVTTTPPLGIAIGTVTPRPLNVAANTPPRSPAGAYGRIGTAPMGSGGSLWGSLDCGGNEAETVTELTVNEQFKFFVANHLSGCLAKIAAETTANKGGGARGGRTGGRSGGRGGNRGGQGGGAMVTRKGVGAAGSRYGEGQSDARGSACLKGLEGVDEQVSSLYSLYPGSYHLPMTMRSLLRICRDADLKRQAGVVLEDVKKLFQDANGFLLSAGDSGQWNAGSLPGSGGFEGQGLESQGGTRAAAVLATVNPLTVDLVAASTTVDLDFLDQELMPDEFKVVMAGLFELSRDRASTKNAGGDVSSLDHSSIDPLKEKETDAEEGSQGAIQETGMEREPSPDLSPDKPLDSDTGREGEIMGDLVIGSEKKEVVPEEALAPGEGLDNTPLLLDDKEKYLAVPGWLTTPKAFVTQVLEWAEEGRAKKASRAGREQKRSRARVGREPGPHKSTGAMDVSSTTPQQRAEAANLTVPAAPTPEAHILIDAQEQNQHTPPSPANVMCSAETAMPIPQGAIRQVSSPAWEGRGDTGLDCAAAAYMPVNADDGCAVIPSFASLSSTGSDMITSALGDPSIIAERNSSLTTAGAEDSSAENSRLGLIPPAAEAAAALTPAPGPPPSAASKIESSTRLFFAPSDTAPEEVVNSEATPSPIRAGEGPASARSVFSGIFELEMDSPVASPEEGQGEGVPMQSSAVQDSDSLVIRNETAEEPMTTGSSYSPPHVHSQPIQVVWGRRSPSPGPPQALQGPWGRLQEVMNEMRDLSPQQHHGSSTSSGQTRQLPGISPSSPPSAEEYKQVASSTHSPYDSAAVSNLVPGEAPQLPPPSPSSPLPPTVAATSLWNPTNAWSCTQPPLRLPHPLLVTVKSPATNTMVKKHNSVASRNALTLDAFSPEPGMGKTASDQSAPIEVTRGGLSFEDKRGKEARVSGEVGRVTELCERKPNAGRRGFVGERLLRAAEALSDSPQLQRAAGVAASAVSAAAGTARVQFTATSQRIGKLLMASAKSFEDFVGEQLREDGSSLVLRREGSTGLLIPRGKTLTQTFIVGAGCYLCWEFIVKDYDLGFALRRRSQSMGGSTEEDIFELKRYSSGETFQGRWTADGDATSVLVMVWDNSYSCLRPKTLAYKVQVLQPGITSSPPPPPPPPTPADACTQELITAKQMFSSREGRSGRGVGTSSHTGETEAFALDESEGEEPCVSTNNNVEEEKEILSRSVYPTTK